MPTTTPFLWSDDRAGRAQGVIQATLATRKLDLVAARGGAEDEPWR